LRLFIGIALFVTCITQVVGQTKDHSIAIFVDAKITDVVQVGQRIDVVKVHIVKDNKPIDSLVTQRGHCRIRLDTGHVYKIYFSKSGYVGKHFVVNTKEVPPSYTKKSTIKIEVSMFKSNPEMDFSFLAQKPIGIAAYNFVSKRIQWDAEYTRIMIQQIIDVTVDNYKKKGKD
jgi:hypothetical protein